MGAPRRIAALALAAAMGLVAAACGGGEERAGEARPESTAGAATATAPAAPEAAPPRPRPRPLPGLPAFTAGFQGWDRLNAEPIPPDSAQTRRVGFDAHRGTKDVYVSVPRGRLTRGGEFPEGTILVKAARTDGVMTLAAIMRKIQGVEPRPRRLGVHRVQARERRRALRHQLRPHRPGLLELPPDRRGDGLGLHAARPLIRRRPSAAPGTSGGGCGGRAGRPAPRPPVP